MQCPACGWKSMRSAKRDLPFSYKGTAIVVRGVRGQFCPKCDEAVLDEAESARYAGALEALVRRVNLAALPDLKSIRKRLRLTQAEAADLFGGGVNAFSRYERGETEPPKSLVQIFKLLETRPELLNLFRLNAGTADSRSVRPVRRARAVRRPARPRPPI